MARVTVFVDRALLVKCLLDVEKDGPLANLSQLYNKTAELYNKDAQTPITHSVVMLRIKEWGIVVQTKPGKKGPKGMSSEHKAAMLTARGARKTRAEKIKKYASNLEKMRSLTPKVFLPLVDAMENGSLTAAVKRNCLECSHWERKEVRNCVIDTCSFYPFRPFQGKEDEDPDIR